MLGKTIDGRFAIEREVGAGGMGVVYRARDLQNGGVTVAFKVLSEVGAEAARRFEREASLLSELQHPGIVRYVAHGSIGEGPRYLVMEWVEGQGLDQRMASTGVDVAEAVALLAQVSAALAEAHRLGVVHRDLKPSNILLRDGLLERATVIDFGIARRVQENQKLTKTGQVVGSPGYLAPEQAQGNGPIDARADVFALGCLLYECLTGRAAFSGEHLVALFVRLMIADPDPLVELCPEAPPELEALLDRVLSKDPAARPVDAGALLLELEALGKMPTGRRRPRTYEPAMTIVASGPTDVLSAPGEGKFIVLALGSEEWGGSTAQTLTNENMAMIDGALQAEVVKLGARIDSFIDGSLLALVSGELAAERAARVAMKLRARMPDAPIVLASASASTIAALDENLRSLERDLLAGMFLAPGAEARPSDAIRLDEVTATALALGNAFSVRRDPAGPYLLVVR